MSNTSVGARSVDGLHQIIGSFDTIVTDQFGVLHDGTEVYPGVIDCLHILKDRGIRIAALSNSGRRSDVNRERLQEFGFASSLFDVVLTSGETAWLTLKNRDLPFLQQVRSVFLVKGEGDSSILDDLDYSIAQDVADADLVLITGADRHRYELQHYQEQLQPAMQAKLPCICANPDVHTLFEGTTTYGPGSIAEYYATSGAPVVYFGKPHLPVYTRLISMLEHNTAACPVAANDANATGTDRSRILCVGDSPAHDIRGAQSAGLASALVLTGLQAMDPAVRHAGEATADFVLPGLIW